MAEDEEESGVEFVDKSRLDYLMVFWFVIGVSLFVYATVNEMWVTASLSLALFVTISGYERIESWI